MIIDRFSPDGLTPLWTKSQLESALETCQLPDWVKQSYIAFVETIQRNNFPCFFSTLAEQKEMIGYAIAPSLNTSESLEHILEAVYTYLEQERNLKTISTEEDSLLFTLVIFFPLEAQVFPLEHYAEQAYAFLNGLHQRDRFPWPEDIPTDPTNSEWRYCLGNRSLFVNISTPANQNRRSRNLGPGLIAVMNVDDVFERVWKRWGEQPRHEIYKRMEKYDLIPPSPLLWHWESEWERDLQSAKLTVLSDRNSDECIFPFRYHSSTVKHENCPYHQATQTE